MVKVIDFGTGKEGPRTIGHFMQSTDGVYLLRKDKDGNALDPLKFCASLTPVALARDTQQQNWGVLVRFNDSDGVPHSVVISNEMIASSSEEVIRTFARHGLKVEPVKDVKRLLCEYLSVSWPTARVRLVNQTGWYGHQFVLPHLAVGNEEETTYYQGQAMDNAFACFGSLEGWQEEVSRLCIGNSRLLLAVCIAFAATLLEFSGGESGGIHYCGSSSTGKTTALRVSASVCGGPRYVKSWHVTINGVEALAAAHNQCLLAFDEMGQSDPWQIFEIIYLLFNNMGKGRANQNGEGRTRAAWQLIFLSSGEVGLAQHIQAGGKQAMAGQMLRLVDIPADAGVGLGMFENLHGYASGAEFAETLNANVKRNYGVALVAFLERLIATNTYSDLKVYVPMYCSRVMSILPLANACGQVKRVAERFALIGAAGELATSLGITAWPEGEAAKAAVTCFEAWLAERPTEGQAEHHDYIESLRRVIEMQNDKFRDYDVTSDRTISDCYGFKRKVPGTDCYEYFVFPSAWKDVVCKGYIASAMSRYLADKGYLACHKAINQRLPGYGSPKCYHVLSTVFQESAGINDFDPDDIIFPKSDCLTGNTGNSNSDDDDIPF